MNSWVFVSLMLAHVVGDFYMQTDELCRQKEEKGLRCRFLYVHSILIGLLSWLLVPAWGFWPYALVVSATHLVIDAMKACYPKGVWGFFVDQGLHVAVLFAVSLFIGDTERLPIQWINVFPSCSLPLLLLAWLLCMKPANILIKLILEKYNVGTQSCDGIKEAGALIGNLERMLTIVFVAIGHYEAIGFIVAAKSILRFKDTDTPKAEYVLAGTFLSFGIAVVCGIIALKAPLFL